MIGRGLVQGDGVWGRKENNCLAIEEGRRGVHSWGEGRVSSSRERGGVGELCIAGRGRICNLIRTMRKVDKRYIGLLNLV